MICDKCKYEFFEGRNCPNCGNLAIFVNDDDYENRKAEWEEENKQEEPPQTTEKIKKFTIDKEKIIKAAVIGAAAVAAVTVVTICIMLILHYADQKKYIILYDNGTVINSRNKNVDVFDSENAVFSADGYYAYKSMDLDITGDMVSSVVSKNGKYDAIVSVSGYDMDEAEYYLYRYDRSKKELTDILHGSENIRIVSVTNEGKVIYEAAEPGAYNVIVNSSIYLFDGEKKMTIADDVSDFVSCENDGDFLYYDTQMNVYLYSDGKIKELTEDAISNEESRYVCTNKGKCYYVTGSGDLYDAAKNKLIDSKVNTGTLNNVAGADKITYVKDGCLYIYGSSIKNPVVLIENYDYYGSKIKVLENSGKIYFTYQDTLYICNKAGKVKSTENQIKGVYFALK